MDCYLIKLFGQFFQSFLLCLEKKNTHTHKREVMIPETSAIESLYGGELLS